MILLEPLSDTWDGCMNCYSHKNLYRMTFAPSYGMTDTKVICKNCLRKLRDDIVSFIDCDDFEKETVNVFLEEKAKLPKRAHPIDAGMDIYSPVECVVPARESAVIDTHVHVQIPTEYAGFLKSKSGLNVKHGITSEGVIDAGYTGSVVVKLYNHSDEDYHVMEGEKISQLVLVKIGLQQPVDAEALPETERGDGGFGSTGRR